MPAVINFTTLVSELRKVPETLVDQEEREIISPYLLETVLPLLQAGVPPLLRDIDYEQFEQEDPPRLVGYLEKCEHRSYRLEQFNDRLCGLSPACVKTRAFL